MPHRLTPRIIPASPITVAIEEEARPVLAYGAIADISGNGACVWTDARLDVGQTLRFRISFPSPPEVHELVGVVVWAQDTLEGMGEQSRRYGIEWLGASRECRVRLRELAHRAVPQEGGNDQLFQKAWLVDEETG
jgi:hypothetical protein